MLPERSLGIGLWMDRFASVLPGDWGIRQEPVIHFNTPKLSILSRGGEIFQIIY